MPILGDMGDLFGVAVSPFELDEWQQATGIKPDLCMIFESWSRQRALTDICTKAKSFGHESIAITWEPWEPTPVGTPPEEQGIIQHEWCNDSILAGNHDDYIDAVARSLRDSGLTVYLRFGHEMNGTWYPWRHDAANYVEAWKYVRNRMRSVRNGWNIKFVWSPNPDVWRNTPADWLAKLLPYWPGQAAVDLIGFTMINFGGDHHYEVGDFVNRIDISRRIFRKGICAMELNVERDSAIGWLEDLATYIRSIEHCLPLVILSQGASRAAAVRNTGDLSWSPVSDPATRDALRSVVDALHR